MSKSCPCGRKCTDCPYENLCDGCLEDSCIHVRLSHKKEGRRTPCLFCSKTGARNRCTCSCLAPPKEFACISPWVLEDTIDQFNARRTGYQDQPDQPRWPLLIPEVSDATETASRFAVLPEEGDWSFPRWKTIAWDMTGYLIDKAEGAPWVRKGHESNNWRFIFGSDESWVEDLLLVDRLPDYLAIQSPPSAIIGEYIVRLLACQWNMIADDDAPSLWLLTHGYPSYIDWPPAWHWNLGIRMLSSLAAYVGAVTSEVAFAPGNLWYPDKSKKTHGPISAPFAFAGEESRLLFPPHMEIEWDRFPGIIPFVPGADSKQLSWFANQITGMGYEVLALDALNTLSNENFKGIREAVACVKRSGAKHVIVYGPWPLHPPSDYVPTNHVSYIASAYHMDMTNSPPRYWHSRNRESTANGEWHDLPNYRIAPLKEVCHNPSVELCDCPACRAAKAMEDDPRSIWRWGHLLRAGMQWQRRVGSQKQRSQETTSEETRLWYQGPSYTPFRCSLHHSKTDRQPCLASLDGALTIGETEVTVRYLDGFAVPLQCIRWTGLKVGHEWADDFPRLEGMDCQVE